jgi:hypothetical protein
MGWVVLVLVVGIGAAVLWHARAAAVETPAYAVEVAEGPIELRRYPPMIAAEVTRTGDRQAAVRAGFGPLARYIFGRDRAGEKIAMTAPVTQTPAGGAWTVRFLMPAGWTMETLPAPAGDVRLVELPAQRMAAIRFSGRWTDARFAEAEARLRDWLAARGLSPAGPPVHTYYNDPFTPAFLRRNEVLLPLGD